MGPLANPRRVNAIAAFVADAEAKGAKVATGGKRMGNQGNFFEPTALTDVPENARIMNEEPFGPVAVMLRFKETDDVLARANKLPFGLASYAFTRDAKAATRVADSLESDMVTINHFGIALPRHPSEASTTRASAVKVASRGCRSTCRARSSVTWGERGRFRSRPARIAGVCRRPDCARKGLR